MSNNWEKYEKRNWPSGSLEKLLKEEYPGCKNVKEAMEVERHRQQIKAADEKEKLKQNDTAAQVMFPVNEPPQEVPKPHEKKDDIEW